MSLSGPLGHVQSDGIVRLADSVLQLPVPAQLDGQALTALIDPDKDVDGLTTVNAGRLFLGEAGLRPCTPSGVMELLASVDAQLEGAEAVVIGRSNLFGKPMAQMLLAAKANVERIDANLVAGTLLGAHIHR